MSFGDVIRSNAAPSPDVTGIGGDDTKIWCGESFLNLIYELSILDLSEIRNAPSPSTEGTGTGGNASIIWHCDYFSDEIYELSILDFSVVRNNSAPGGASLSIGGDASTIWHGDAGGNTVYELSTIDFSVIRSDSIPGDPNGIGGDSNTIWCADYDNSLTYELSTSDFSIVRSAPTPNWATNGIGGNASTIWACSPNSNLIYELDVGAPVIYTISGNVKDLDGNNISNVTILFEDSTSYETSTDINGNYSQVVDPDVYTVTASKNKYLDSSASVDATASDQTQNFVLSKPVISGNIKDNKGYNINGVIIVFTDDTSYETTTDSDGNYSQEVDTDEYTVEASLAGYVPDSASVDVTASDQTQNFILSTDTAPHDKGIYLGNRYLLRNIINN